MDLQFVASGFAVGLLVGMTGVGGGSLMTPLLTLLFGVTPAVAVGTDLAFASLTKGVGTFTHRLRGTVHWDIVRRLCLGALPAALLASLGLKYFGTLSKEMGQIIRYTIAGSVMLTSRPTPNPDATKSKSINFPKVGPKGNYFEERSKQRKTYKLICLLICSAVASRAGMGVAR